MIFIPTFPFKPQMWPALISLWSAENATWLLNPFEDYLINCLLNNNGKTQRQILSNLFFDVVLLRCQKLIPRDQLLKSRLRFASLDAYFVHKCFHALFLYILQWHKSSQTSAPFHWQPGVPVQKERNRTSLVPRTSGTYRRPQEH